MAHNNLTKDPIRLIQVSDAHVLAQPGDSLLKVDTRLSLEGVLNSIRKNDADMDALLITGDISQNGAVAAYHHVLEQVSGMAPIIRVLPGNHDHVTTLKQVWQAHTQPITDLGNWRVVMLDSSLPESNAGHLAEDQLDLLEQACATASQKHVLVAVHHNPVPVGSLWLDTMMIDNGHQLFAIIQRHPNVQAVLWGHVHQVYDSTYNFGVDQTGPDTIESAQGAQSNRRQVRLMACPATSFQFLPQSSSFALDSIAPGYRRLWLYPDGRLETEVVRVEGITLAPDLDSTGY